MSTTMSIPAPLIPLVREGTYTLVRDVAETIETAANDAQREQDPSAFREIRSRLDGIWSLLDVIGWSTTEDPDPVELHGHVATVTEAVALMAPLMETWLSEMPDADPEKPGRAEEYRLLRQFEAQLRTGGGRGCVTP